MDKTCPQFYFFFCTTNKHMKALKKYIRGIERRDGRRYPQYRRAINQVLIGGAKKRSREGPSATGRASKRRKEEDSSEEEEESSEEEEDENADDVDTYYHVEYNVDGDEYENTEICPNGRDSDDDVRIVDANNDVAPGPYALGEKVRYTLSDGQTVVDAEVTNQPNVMENRFTTEQNRLLNRFFTARGRRREKNETVVQRFPPLRSSDFKKLKENTDLNDTLIDAYTKLLGRRRGVEEIDNDGRHRIWFPSVFFITQLFAKTFEEMKRSAKKFHKDQLVQWQKLGWIVVPCNVSYDANTNEEGGNHWACAVVDFTKQRIRYYDSIFNEHTLHWGGRIMRALYDYVRWVTRDLSNNTVAINWGDDPANFMSCAPPRGGSGSDGGTGEDSDNDEPETMPQQRDGEFLGNDCGAFVCQTIKCLTRHNPERRRIDFTQDDIPFLRRVMCLELARGDTMDEL